MGFVATYGHTVLSMPKRTSMSPFCAGFGQRIQAGLPWATLAPVA